MTTFAEQYGPWAVVNGASDGIGAAFAEELAARDVNVVLVARRQPLLEDLAGRLNVETRVAALDLSRADAAASLAAATEGLEVGLFVSNAGADSHNTLFLDTSVVEWEALVRRNCLSVLGACHHFGGRMVARGRGGMILVSSGAAWAGGSHLVTYAATKAFDVILAEGLWSEWRQYGIDVLSLVLGSTDTPSLRRTLEKTGGDLGPLASPSDVACTGLDHLADGPVWNYASDDPTGPSPFGSLPRRRAAELMSQGSAAMFVNRQ
jgi:short-subunit dehydrogenase